MDATHTRETAVEVCKVLDRLTALSVDLSCHCDDRPHGVILPAGKVQDSCQTINEAVESLKHILRLAESSGGGLIPPGALSSADARND